MTGVRSYYDEGKRMAEMLNMDYHKGAGLEVSFFFFFIYFFLTILNISVNVYFRLIN